MPIVLLFNHRIAFMIFLYAMRMGYLPILYAERYREHEGGY